MADYVEVIDAGPGWTRVRDAEGNEFTLKGARNWRNNNPGNIEFGPFAQAAGAVGSDGRFAVFPSYEQGRAAKEQLIFSSPSYRDLTLEQAISRYAPPSENNTSAYLNAVTRAANVSKDTRMGQMAPATRQAVLDAMQKVEGFQVGRTLNAQGIPLPPAEIPNVVASLTDTIPPRTPPVPATMTPDLSLMRNPLMSTSASAAQVTPNVPLPRPRPSSPDIVTQTMARLQTPASRPNTTRAADIGLTRPNAVTPRLTAQGDNAYTYWIPDVTPASLVGGRGSLTPSVGTAPRPAQQSPQLASIRSRDQDLQMALNSRYPPTPLPPLPPSNIGQAPTTRTVQSVPMNMAPTAREIANAPGVTVATIPTVQPIQPIAPAMNTRSRDSVAQGQAGQRVATQIAPAFAAPGYVPNRLMPSNMVQPTNVASLNPIQIVPNPALPLPHMAAAPTPMPASRRPFAPIRLIAPMPSARPVASAAPSPLRIVVNGGNYTAPRPQPLTPIQTLQTAGLSSADAYAMANAQAAQRARDNATSPEHLSTNDYFNRVTGRA